MSLPWHHSPAHQFVPAMLHMVTAGTLNKLPFFHGDDRLDFLRNRIWDILAKHEWRLQAWAVFSNHYHFIAKSPNRENSLANVIRELHSSTSREINRRDHARERQVWFQYWDTCLTYEKSWLARLNYINNNPVQHRLVRNAIQYPYCSATWFRQRADPSFGRKVASFRYDRLRIVDEY